ncbi:MAG TPA: SpoIID/LytB domain-containing protein [Planctomycetota bacterium]|nr:SpoIID/LytB domain-containing protein [Planctomycetota bacterium]
MKRCLYLVLLTSLLAGCVSGGAATPFYRYETAKKILNEPPYLQVLLAEYNNVASAMIKVNTTYAVYSYLPNRDSKFIGLQPLSKQNATPEPVKVSNNDGDIVLGGAGNFLGSDIVLVPASSSALILVGPPDGRASKRNYKGRLRIKAMPNNKIALVNIIDMESYLPGVVSSEMDESWPQDSLAAQAISARSFAFFRIKQFAIGVSKKPFDYDLTDDIYSQAYRGEERTGPKTKQAVEQTRGVVMSYESKIFNCLFHDTCGGHTEPGDLIFSLTPIPPLAGRNCGFCYHSKHSQWKVEFTQDEISNALGLKGAIEAILVTKTAPGGHAVELLLKISGRNEPIIFQAQKFRIALNPNKLQSTLFKVTKKDRIFEFIGRGWGHAVGLCQEGTRGMSEKGFTPLQVLEYYYPQAKVVKIY